MQGRLLHSDLVLDAPSLRAARERITRGVLGAAKRAVTRATREVEQALEGATREAAPGRLWRAWKSDVFPRGSAIAREPAGIVFINGGLRSRGAIEFMTRPGRIRGKSGQFLAIPTPAAGSRGRGRVLTPADWERRTGQKLRFVYRRNKPSLLVAEGNVTARSGRFRQLTARQQQTGRRAATIVVFILVPQVSFANRFAIDPIVRRVGGRLDNYFTTELRQLPNR